MTARSCCYPFLVLLMLLAACGTSAPKILVQVSPPQASVYVNGKKMGQSREGLYAMDFSNSERVYVQVTAPRFTPLIKWYTRQDIDDMLAINHRIILDLRERR